MGQFALPSSPLQLLVALAAVDGAALPVAAAAAYFMCATSVRMSPQATYWFTWLMLLRDTLLDDVLLVGVPGGLAEEELMEDVVRRSESS